MSNPISSSAHLITDIASEAIDQLHGAIQTIFELEALFRAIRKESCEHSDVKRLTGIGEYNAAGQGNGFDLEHEGLLERLKAATQNAEIKNVARTAGANQ